MKCVYVSEAYEQWSVCTYQRHMNSGVCVRRYERHAHIPILSWSDPGLVLVSWGPTCTHQPSSAAPLLD